MQGERSSEREKPYELAVAVLRIATTLALALTTGCGSIGAGFANVWGAASRPEIELGDRPAALIASMSPGPLRDRLESCLDGPFRSTRFSIGHRGAPRHHPEHTRASYRDAARMGAGLIECDVTFTADGVAVCRHSQCDLATTTNLLETALAETCRAPFRPAAFDPESGDLTRPATALCCTSDLELEEFLRLEGRSPGRHPDARSLEAFLAPPPGRDPRPSSEGGEKAHALLTHDESIALFQELGVAMIPERKADLAERGRPALPSEPGEYARHVLDAYRDVGVPPDDVRLQSFQQEDIRTWLALAPDYGARAIWLVEAPPDAPTPSEAEFAALYAEGFRALGPPIPMLLELDAAGRLRATEFARRARAAGLELFAWTIERSGQIENGSIEGRRDDFYLGGLLPALETEGDLFEVIHALAREVGVRGVFSDWPATTTYYANCFGLD